MKDDKMEYHIWSEIQYEYGSGRLPHGRWQTNEPDWITPELKQFHPVLKHDQRLLNKDTGKTEYWWEIWVTINTLEEFMKLAKIYGGVKIITRGYEPCIIVV